MKRHARPGRKTSTGTHLENPTHHTVGRGRAVFISYAHADNSSPDPAARWLDRLLLNLKAFEELLSVATDRDIGLGDAWHARIQANLNRAGAAVLLVSPAFLASEYIRNNELPVLLHRAKTQGLRIVPVILRPCSFAETRFKYPDPRTGPEEFSLALLQAAGSPAKALNEMSEGEQDRALLSVAQALKQWIDRPNAAPSEALGSAAASGIPEPLSEFRARLAAGGAVPELDEETRQALLCHAPATVEEYRLARVAEWSQPRYELDKRFTRLTLLLDQGPEAQGARWQAEARPRPFDDLRDVLNETDATALVLLGPPGCGKSTLLRRPARAGGDPPPPRDWLAEEWAQRHPRLPGLPELLGRGPFLLLLDAMNEIPHAGPEDYRERIGRWRELLADLAREAPGVRAVFTCRSLQRPPVHPRVTGPPGADRASGRRAGGTVPRRLRPCPRPGSLAGSAGYAPARAVPLAFLPALAAGP